MTEKIYQRWSACGGGNGGWRCSGRCGGPALLMFSFELLLREEVAQGNGILVVVKL